MQLYHLYSLFKLVVLSSIHIEVEIGAVPYIEHVGNYRCKDTQRISPRKNREYYVS